MNHNTREIIERAINEDSTIDKRVIGAVMQLLESFDTRTPEQVEEEVAECVMHYLTKEKRTRKDIENMCNHKFRINPERRFNPIALKVVLDITSNPKKYNVLCQNKGGTKVYFFKVDKQ